MDITSRRDIELLIQTFYGKVTKDDTIGFIFNDVAKPDWEKHLPIMYDFWETILLDTASYQRNAMEVHYAINKMVKLQPQHFQRWLALFTSTVDELFAGTKAELAKTRANGIASVLQHKMNIANRDAG